MAATALHDQPLLAIPTLVIAVGVLGLAIIEAATITVQVATVMIRHYHHACLSFLKRFAIFVSRFCLESKRLFEQADALHNESTRSRVIQKIASRNSACLTEQAIRLTREVNRPKGVVQALRLERSSPPAKRGPL